MKRRDFIIKTSLAAGFFTLPFAKHSVKKVLILGGTNFVGPYIINDAVKLGWNITLFNRGITNPHLFPDLKRIKGDRLKMDDVKKMADEHWDIVIDTWSKNPYAVKYSTAVLKEKTRHYAYVSSIAVYGGKNYRTVGITEETELPKLEPLPEDVSKLDYVKNKIYAENLVREIFPSSHSIYRPHTIFGTDPASGTLTNSNLRIGGRCYWMWRIDIGGDILAPGAITDTMQFTDVKDLAGFLIKAVNEKLTGAYNVFQTVTMKEMFDAICSIKRKDSKPNLVWVPASFLFENKLGSPGDVPMWASQDEPDKGFYQISNAKALKAGLSLRPASETFRETIEAFYKYHSDFNFKDEKSGVKLAIVENELLKKWEKEEN